MFPGLHKGEEGVGGGGGGRPSSYCGGERGAGGVCVHVCVCACARTQMCACACWSAVR